MQRIHTSGSVSPSWVSFAWLRRGYAGDLAYLYEVDPNTAGNYALQIDARNPVHFRQLRSA